MVSSCYYYVLSLSNACKKKKKKFNSILNYRKFRKLDRCDSSDPNSMGNLIEKERNVRNGKKNF